MQKLSLVKLIQTIEIEMLRLGYSRRSMAFYRRRWKQLIAFAKSRNEEYYSEHLGLDFIETYFHILEKDINGKLNQTQIQELRVIHVIGDFQLHGTILRRQRKSTSIPIDQNFIDIHNRFNIYCISKGYSVFTIRHHVSQASRFLYYLSSHKIQNCKDISLESIHSYIKTLSGYRYRTVEHHIGTIRAFLRFLLEIDVINVDYASKIPMIHARKQTAIPSVWSPNELKMLIEAIDRGSPNGKRDYAIILLACYVGMRCCDIKRLKLENFHWQESHIVFIQSKTKTAISLPLMPQIGWAIIDYLKYGRPKIDSSYLFVRHNAPFLPFVEQDNMYSIIKKYMKLANLPMSKKKCGLHSLRHTLASMLLECDTPLSTISDILGHIDPDSTSIYLKVNINKLKECALNFEDDNYD